MYDPHSNARAVWFVIAFPLAIAAITVVLAFVGRAFRSAALLVLRSSDRPERTCGRDGCGCINPAAAHYCRRCGAALAAEARPRHVEVR